MNDLPDPVDPPSSPAMAGRGAGAGPPDVLVLGAGLAGLAAAWELLEAGARVTVVDRSPPGSGTSHVAAGMLAPVVEAEPDHPEQLALGLAALRAWPAFAARLR
ncbi:FAD-dependent oxidoreductase, partial [Patulibacter medicamentivorans]|uniref:FAD-dependent oxidoreductase n=1 Tax=Patulibacter medicamentivorans TaxID=1097667 RepID=UPI00058B28DC